MTEDCLKMEMSRVGSFPLAMPEWDQATQVKALVNIWSLICMYVCFLGDTCLNVISVLHMTLCLGSVTEMECENRRNDNNSMFTIQPSTSGHKHLCNRTSIQISLKRNTPNSIFFSCIVAVISTRSKLIPALLQPWNVHSNRIEQILVGCSKQLNQTELCEN